jgi:uncharacterized protein (DUF952 family)
MRIVHIAAQTDWMKAEGEGSYAPASLASEGFIHCSDPRQVVSVANRLFHGRTDLVLLHIETDRLLPAVRYENLEGGSELFPHIYGRVNLAAVVGVTPFQPSSSGTFDPVL